MKGKSRRALFLFRFYNFYLTVMVILQEHVSVPINSDHEDAKTSTVWMSTSLKNLQHFQSSLLDITVLKFRFQDSLYCFAKMC